MEFLEKLIYAKLKSVYSAPFQPFFGNSVKILAQKFTSKHFFRRLRLCYAAEKSANWQHWIYEQKIGTCRFKCFSRIF
jgi:hypothetical protein